MNTPQQLPIIFLKSCYISAFFLLLSCGADTNKKKETQTQSTPTTETQTPVKTSNKTLVFFGDSLTAGYGLDDVDDAFPGRIQQKIDSLALDYTVVNSGISGETTAGGKNRIDWVLNQEPSIFVLALGANDGLRGVPLNETKQNLQAIIDAVHQKYLSTKIVLAGMQLPPNMGPDYTSQFQALFPAIAKKNNIELIPFLLEDVGGIPSLNQADGIHPTEEGHQIMANTVWEILAPLVTKS